MKAKTFIASSILAASAVASSVAMAESNWSANIGVTSNYMWRGVTQTTDQAAIQGGIDYENPNGFYAGTWMSNVSWTEPVAKAAAEIAKRAKEELGVSGLQMQLTGDVSARARTELQTRGWSVKVRVPSR